MKYFFVLIFFLLLGGCATKSDIKIETLDKTTLQNALMALSPSVSKQDASRVATISYEVSSELEKRYKRDSSPMFHNFLVNIGIKDSGLCYEYADELLERLREASPKTLNIYRVISKKGEYFEHNALLATSKQSLQEGIIIDPWRSAEPLFWVYLSKDRYNWSILKK